MFVLLLGATSARDLHAQTIYDDGGTHTVNGPSGPIEVTNGSTLNVVSPASVSGMLTSPGMVGASIYGDANSTINMSGGQIVADPSIGVGIQTLGTFAATGGFVEGSFGLVTYGPVQISGGSFLGTGTRFDQVGAQVEISQPGQSATISGGTFEGGSAIAQIGIGLSLLVDDGGHASITGGYFVGGGIAPGGLYSASLVYYGGEVGAADIYGGVFSGDLRLYLVGAASTLTFHGRDFQLVGSQFTGILSDGNAIDVSVAGGGFSTSIQNDNGVETFTFAGILPSGPPAVPEPSSLLMLAIGVGGASIALARRRQPLDARRPAPALNRSRTSGFGTHHTAPPSS